MTCYEPPEPFFVASGSTAGVDAGVTSDAGEMAGVPNAVFLLFCFTGLCKTGKVIGGAGGVFRFERLVVVSSTFLWLVYYLGWIVLV